MIYLLSILASIALFAAFLGLTIMEARNGVRVFAVQRKRLDKSVARASFVIKHVNWIEFFTNSLQSFFERVIHDIAHYSLIFVRFMEHELTSVVRYLRDRRPNMLAPKPSRTPLLMQISGYIRNTFRIPSKKDSEIED